jgi:amidohydrolase
MGPLHIPKDFITEIRSAVRKVGPSIRKIRHDLHAIPELGLEEYKTSAYIREYLKDLDLEFLEPLAGTDVCGLIQGGEKGKIVGLRADIDALPINDQSGNSWASTHPGMSHACGHDGNAAVLIGAVTVLSLLRDKLPGAVKFILQPGEEKVGGGKKLVENGVLEIGGQVDAVFAMHGTPGIPLGAIAGVAGPTMAAADRFKIRIEGKGGHAAQPHKTIDPIVIAAQVVQAFQTIVSRKINPMDPAVVSVCTIHGGSADNAIADELLMEGTTRYYSEKSKEIITTSMESILQSCCSAAGAGYSFEYSEGYRPLVNQPGEIEFAKRAALTMFGPDCWLEGYGKTMAAEDFSYYLEKVPGAYLRLGLGESSCRVHNEKFDFNDAALEPGIIMLCGLAAGFLFEPVTS